MRSKIMLWAMGAMTTKEVKRLEMTTVNSGIELWVRKLVKIYVKLKIRHDKYFSYDQSL